MCGRNLPSLSLLWSFAYSPSWFSGHFIGFQFASKLFSRRLFLCLRATWPTCLRWLHLRTVVLSHVLWCLRSSWCPELVLPQASAANCCAWSQNPEPTTCSTSIARTYVVLVQASAHGPSVPALNQCRGGSCVVRRRTTSLWLFGNQSTHHTVNMPRRKMVWRADRLVWRRCDELTVLFDIAFVAFKSFAVVGDFEIDCTRCSDMPCCTCMCNVSFLSSFNAHK